MQNTKKGKYIVACYESQSTMYATHIDNIKDLLEAGTITTKREAKMTLKNLLDR